MTILIGMPGSGKTTLGKELSKIQFVPFIDTDDLIIKQNGRPVKELIGPEFSKIEKKAILSIPFYFNGVISTGGSVIYSEPSMVHLRTLGEIVYLQVSLDELHNRIKNFDERGIVIKEGMTFEDLYNERCPIYEEWADYTIVNDNIEETILKLKDFY